MNIVNKLTLRHLRLNRGRTALTLFAIMLSVAMVCAVAGFVLSLRDLLMRGIKEQKGDYHVVFADVTEENAKALAGNSIFASSYTTEGDSEGLQNVYLRLRHPNRRDALSKVESAAQTLGLQNASINHELLGLEGVFALGTVLIPFLMIAAIVILIIIAGSVTVIANAFYISASERVRQFGLLKSTGATSGQIGRSILFEACFLSVIAIPLGILFGFLIQAAVLWLTNDLLREISAMNDTALAFHVVFHPAILYISVAVAFLTILISAWLPARRAARTSAIDAIRRAKDVKIQSKTLKTSRLTQKLFGFEGTLAAKSLKRSRGKYRATVISLTVSIVLFVSMSSFVWLLNKDTEMMYGGNDIDVVVSVYGELETLDAVDGLLRGIPRNEATRIQRLAMTAAVPDGFYTERAQGMAQAHQLILLYSMPDAEFEKIAPLSQNTVNGILINTTGSMREDGRLVEYVPYQCELGTELSFGFMDDGGTLQTRGSITVAGVFDKIPASLPSSFFAGHFINVFIPESDYRELYSSGDAYTEYAVTTDDSDAYCEAAFAALNPFRENVNIRNVTQMTRLNRNITLIVSLFGYGFIAMLSLIAVTSVVATISTGMALRRQEFAMLYSVGMTSKGMSKMLNLESLLYGFKSLLIGLPVGTALSYLLFRAMGGVMEFSYQPPWTAMVISVAAVMLLTFSTMRYGKQKLRGISIIESLRSEVA